MLHPIKNNSGEKLPRVPFRDIAAFALPKDYVLSIVFVDHKLSKKLNNTYRKKNKPTNILSFPLEKNEGEIFIDVKIVREEAKTLHEKESAYLAYVFIHGVTHLKGFDHGSRMEAEEAKIRRKFKLLFASSNLL